MPLSAAVFRVKSHYKDLSMQTTREQLQNHLNQQDSQALTQLMRQHSDMVYAVCLRILGHHDQAADASQETFIQLLKSAKSITGSLSAWLHRVATTKAIDLARREGRRRHIHSEYIATDPSVDEWKAISLQVDEALNGLDESSRELLIAYFLESRTTSEIARARGVSQPTISRQIQKATERLRQKLCGQKLVITTAALTGLLLDHATQATPPLVIKELGKMALAGQPTVLAQATSHGWWAQIVAAFKTKLVAITLCCSTALIIYVYQGLDKKGGDPPISGPRIQTTHQMPINLSTPDNTLNTLFRLIPGGEQTFQTCLIDNSEAMQTLRPAAPLTEMLNRLGPPVQILSQTQNGNQVALHCRLTFTQTFQIGNQVINPGQSCELTLDMSQQANQWKIARIASNIMP